MKKHEGLSLMALNALNGSRKQKQEEMKKHEGATLMIRSPFRVQKNRTMKK